MNYKKIYFKIIKRAKRRSLSDGTYVEIHHVTPKCLNGGNDDGNLVILTAKEHCLCHLLLTKIHPLFPQLIQSANLMYNTKSCKRYEWLKKINSNILSKRLKGKIAHNKGVPMSTEQKKKISFIRITKGIAKGDKNPMYGKRGELNPLYGKKRPFKMTGENNPNVKITQSNVDDIRALYNTGLVSYSQLAEIYGIQKAGVFKIVNYKTWRVA